MKIYSTLILLFLSLCVLGQKLDLEWNEPKTINLPEGDYFVLSLKGANYTSQNYYLPEISITKTGKKITELTIKEVNYEPCDILESKLIDPRFYQKEIEFNINSYISGNSHINNITFIPIRINAQTGVAEKLTSLTYSITFEEEISQSNQKLKSSKSSTNSSVLASGNWYKYKLSNTGIYKLTYSQLKNNGVDVDNLNPKTLKMYHNGSGMLPEPNSEFRYQDLNEIFIEVIGQNDGTFNQNDYILFYGESTHKITYDPIEKLFHHKLNIYDDHSYYFLTHGGEDGKRIPTKASPNTFDGTVTSFNEFKYLEEDLENVLKSGREWYGDNYTFVNPRNYNFNTADLVPGSTITITPALMGMIPGANGYFDSKVNGRTLGKQTIFAATNSNYGIKGRQDITNFPINATSLGNPANLNIEISWDNSNNSTGTGHTNYIEVNYLRRLKTSGQTLLFQSIESLNYTNTKYRLNTSAELTLWEVTDPTSPNKVSLNKSSDFVEFTDSSSSLLKYVSSSSTNYKTPSFENKVNNQNLHSLSGTYDFLVIAPEELKNQAQTYVNFKNANGTSSQMVVLEELYNEFSCGAQDVVAIRDFVKFLYEKGGNQLKYLLLFGDASYDYKNKLESNNAYIPIYESYESLDNISTFSSDDFFGFLDNNEGNWTEDYSNDHYLNIGIGRLPIKSSNEAQNAVEKLINYTSNSDVLGKWRNSISFIADDGDNALHTRQADQLTELVLQADSNYNIKKLYVDSYEQITTASGQYSPGFDKSFDNSIDKGNLIINYTGHGSEEQWATEELITTEKIDQMSNYDKLPLYVTATCEFGRYDDPEQVSGGELLFLSTKGGAISLVTTTRPVFSSSNFNLNKAFYAVALSPKNDSTMRTLGEIIMATKNQSLNGVFNRNFSLLGDPSLMLAYPKNNIEITKINESIVNESPDTINALQKVSIEGEVQYHSGKLINSFNGIAYITVYDKFSDFSTLGDETVNGQPLIINYKEQKSILFEGLASVNNGTFKAEFVVPKDISYNFGNGKISMYALPENGHEDANGHLSDIVIGGSAENVSLDDTPPEIQLFMDDESFTNGSIVDENSLLIAKIRDDNGINTAGTGIGHEITAVLDGDDKNTFILNEFYTAKLDSYQEGEVRFLFEGLSDGKHSITFKVWDTHNNSSSSTIYFEVNKNEIEAYNYPNPFSSYTTFVIDQPKSGESGSLEIHIVNMRGEKIAVLEKNFTESSSTTEEITWNCETSSGGNIVPGIYFYRAILRYDSSGQTLSKLERLVKVE